MASESNEQAELLKIITSFLKKNRIPYMITGAWSAIFYGRPRASHDVDFVVELHQKDVKRAIGIFKKLPQTFFMQPDAILEAIGQQSMFNIIHLPTMLKFDFWILSDDQFDKSRFKRRIKVKILNQLMEMASAEDTIIQKLRWYKMGKIEKHLVDAAFVYKVQKDSLDTNYLADWVKKLGLGRYFQRLARINLEEYL